MLMRQKPRPDKERVEYFLFECEREISDWLKNWPAGSDIRSGDAANLKRVADAADHLFREIRKLPEGVKQYLSITMLGGLERGIDVRNMNSAINSFEHHVVELKSAAVNCQMNYGVPITKRKAEDFAYRVAAVFVASFRKRPSTNQGSIYPQVLKEIAENCIPGCQLSIGRRLQESVIGLACFRAGMNE